MLPHPPLEESRTKRDQQVYSYANERTTLKNGFMATGSLKRHFPMEVDLISDNTQKISKTFKD